MSGIFICYRREDSSGYAGRLYDQLVDQYGDDQVFIDVDTMQYGLDFVHQIETAVSGCAVFIAVIGKNWLTAIDEDGNRRLDNPEDFIRIEIKTALERNIPVIPLLVGGAKIPKADILPEDLQDITRRHAIEISDVGFRGNVKILNEAIKPYLPAPSPTNFSKGKKPKTISPTTSLRQNIKNLIGFSRPKWLKLGLIPVFMILLAISFNQLLSIVPFPLSKVEKQKIIGKDGAPMVLIPKGKFMMGSSDEESDSDENPKHTVDLDAFYIDQYEVTTGQYAKLLKKVKRKVPLFWDQVDLTQHKDLPVVGINWHDADGYCRWFGKRLPTEAEWEKAARGTDGRKYPWGSSEPTTKAANYGRYANSYETDLYYVRVNAVGIFEAGKSPFEAYDMAGNVYEWIADWYDPEYYKVNPDSNPTGAFEGRGKVIRGGSWYQSGRALRAADRSFAPEFFRSHEIGFRCAINAE